MKDRWDLRQQSAEVESHGSETKIFTGVWQSIWTQYRSLLNGPRWDIDFNCGEGKRWRQSLYDWYGCITRVSVLGMEIWEVSLSKTASWWAACEELRTRDISGTKIYPGDKRRKTCCRRVYQTSTRRMGIRWSNVTSGNITKARNGWNQRSGPIPAAVDWMPCGLFFIRIRRADLWIQQFLWEIFWK